jgi:transposase
MSIEVRRTYKYRLYRCDKCDKFLRRQINVAGLIWNHARALQKRYYRLTGKYIGLSLMKVHIANLRMKTQRYAFCRKVSDLAFYQFMQILKHVAFKRGKVVVQMSRFERTTGKCSACGHHQKMELRDRTFVCKNCGVVLDRDHNAAINICYAGASAYANRVVVSHVPQKTRRHA